MIPAHLIHSPWIGDVEWDPRSELFFPAGLPGFEEEQRMIPVEIPAQRPLVYLQSLERADVCFVCLPVLVIDAGFQLCLSEEDRATLGISDDREPAPGVDVLCLGLLVPSGDTVQVNLDAPVVISLLNAHGLQSLAPDGPNGSFRLDSDRGWVPLC